MIKVFKIVIFWVWICFGAYLFWHKPLYRALAQFIALTMISGGLFWTCVFLDKHKHDIKNALPSFSLSSFSAYLNSKPNYVIPLVIMLPIIVLSGLMMLVSSIIETPNVTSVNQNKEKEKWEGFWYYVVDNNKGCKGVLLTVTNTGLDVPFCEPKFSIYEAEPHQTSSYIKYDNYHKPILVCRHFNGVNGNSKLFEIRTVENDYSVIRLVDVTKAYSDPPLNIPFFRSEIDCIRLSN